MTGLPCVLPSTSSIVANVFDPGANVSEVDGSYVKDLKISLEGTSTFYFISKFLDSCLIRQA